MCYSTKCACAIGCGLVKGVKVSQKCWIVWCDEDGSVAVWRSLRGSSRAGYYPKICEFKHTLWKRKIFFYESDHDEKKEIVHIWIEFGASFQRWYFILHIDILWSVNCDLYGNPIEKRCMYVRVTNSVNYIHDKKVLHHIDANFCKSNIAMKAFSCNEILMIQSWTVILMLWKEMVMVSCYTYGYITQPYKEKNTHPASVIWIFKQPSEVHSCSATVTEVLKIDWRICFLCLGRFHLNSCRFSALSR